MFKNVNKQNMSAMSTLNETVDFFAAKKINILGEGYNTVKEDEKLFGDYVSSLTEGLNAADSKNVGQLIKNNSSETILESFTNGAAIGALAAPMIRQVYPRLCIKEAVKTVVATTARPMILYSLPYLSKAEDDGTETRKYLPRGLKGFGDVESFFNGGFATRILASGTASATLDFTTASSELEPGSARFADSGSRIKVQPIDRNVTLTFGGKTVKVDSLNGEQFFPHEGGFVGIKIDYKNAKALVFNTGAATDVIVKAHISSEFNELNYDVNIEIHREDYDIASGDHVNSPLSFNQIKDMKTMYNIDATQEVLDTMTQVFGQKTDLELINWLENEFASGLNNSKFGYADVKANGDVDNFPNGAEGLSYCDELSVAFDCAPKGNFAGTPTAWISSELKRLVGIMAQKIKNYTYFSAGQFVIVGNPLDTGLLQDIDWSFQAGDSSNGVSVDYGVGYLSGNGHYKVIATPLIDTGVLRLLFIPSSEKQITYRYMPYVFGTEMNYRSANRTLVPNVMMTKRHTYFSVTPAMAEIYIENNSDGNHGFH